MHYVAIWARVLHAERTACTKALRQEFPGRSGWTYGDERNKGGEGTEALVDHSYDAISTERDGM